LEFDDRKPVRLPTREHSSTDAFGRALTAEEQTPSLSPPLAALRFPARTADVKRMGSRPQLVAFAAGFLTASLLAVAFVFTPRGNGERDRPWALPSRPGAEPVLIVVVGNAARVDLVRNAVDHERIICETVNAFALRERRIVAASFEAVGPMLMEAGWRDDPLEIVAPRPPSKRPDPSRSDADQASKIAELMKKPTLNILEARKALSLL
jgi:hypothetical protein